ncbi:early light-induced protein 1, chloroplastic-like [Silene latifolia]|uniref:early light-induced protein 1, chloroplastic-like n=1 Tax=Silene latifolia TaxID=37657 RepID=UPI003D7878AF
MAMQMQSLVASPISGLGFGSSSTRVVYSTGFRTQMSRRVSVQVKCLAEEGGENEVKAGGVPPSSTPKPTTTPLSTPSPTPTPKPLPKVSTNFGDLFAFSGPAPERINGRLAMIGFVAAVAVELSKGTDIFAQISDGGAQWFLGTSILLSVASLVPLFKGERAESITKGIMNSNAELLNGRLAMLGLVALAFTEYVKGGALV